MCITGMALTLGENEDDDDDSMVIYIYNGVNEVPSNVTSMRVGPSVTVIP